MALAMLLLGGAAVAATPSRGPDVAEPQPTYRIKVEGDLYIGTEGMVTDFRLRSTDLAPDIAAMVGKGVRSWRFEPILVDGRPVNAKTSLELELSLLPVAGGYQLKVVGLGFGNPVRQSHSLQPPEYPSQARRVGLEADVGLVLTVDGDGRVAAVDVESTSLSGKGPQRVMVQWADLFERSAKVAARRWRFEMTETVGGMAVSTRVRVPVQFRITGGQSNWTAFVPVVRPGHYAELKRGDGKDDAQLAASDDRASQQPQALDTRFRLKDDVIGKVL
jgi:TonB family protein